MSDEKTITLVLDRNEAGLLHTAAGNYAEQVTENPMSRALIALQAGVDPWRVAREMQRRIDTAGCAVFGGEPDDYSDLEERPDKEAGDENPVAA